MQKGLIRKGLVLSVIVLLIGVSISSVTSKDISISNMDNNPPGLPIVIGPNGGKPGVTYTFTFIAVDPDGDDVRYIIDWGDGYIDTTTYAPSGFEVDASHMWEKAGVYHGSVKAEDIHGLQGPERYIKFGSGNSKDKEDCIECQVSDGYNLLRAKLLLARLRVIVNFISLISRDIPEVEEKYEEILDIINSNILLNPPIIECANLLMKCVTYLTIGMYCVLIPNFIYPIFPNLALKIADFGYYMNGLALEYMDIAKDLGCIWANVGPPRFSIQV